MRFEQLEILDQMVRATSIVVVICDLATVCQAIAKEEWEAGNRNEFSRFDQHAITLEVVCDFMRNINHERDTRK